MAEDRCPPLLEWTVRQLHGETRRLDEEVSCDVVLLR